MIKFLVINKHQLSQILLPDKQLDLILLPLSHFLGVNEKISDLNFSFVTEFYAADLVTSR